MNNKSIPSVNDVTSGVYSTKQVAFWPGEAFSLHDHTCAVGVVKTGAVSFADFLDEVKAEQLAKRSFDREERRLKMRMECYSEFEKALSPIRAVKFSQLERRINPMINLGDDH